MTVGSLGKLTLDLVANLASFEKPLERAGRLSKNVSKKFKDDFKKLSTAVTGYATAASTAMAFMTKSQIENGARISQLASLSNATTEEFQRYAAAAKAVGFEQEELAQVFKDMGDRVGDFLQANAGPLSDFFTSIAPKVGITAEEFRNLSGPQALVKFTSALQKANVSQNEMTFFMEAVAGNSSELIPLLADNARGFRELGAAAAENGRILDTDTIQAATKAQAAMFVFGETMGGLSKQLTSKMIPVIGDLSIEFAELATNGTGVATLGESLTSVFKGTVAVAFGAYSAFQLVGKSIGALIAVVDAVDIGDIINPLSSPADRARAIKGLFDDDGVKSRIDEAKAVLSLGVEDIRETAIEYGRVIDSIFQAGEGADGGATASAIRSQVDLVSEMFSKLREEGEGVGEGLGVKVAESLKALQMQADTVGMTADQIKIYNLKLQGATESQIQQAEAILKTVAAHKAQEEAAKAAAEQQQEAIDAALERQSMIDENVVDIASRYTLPEDEINRRFAEERALVLENTVLTEEAQTELMKAMERDRQEQLAAIQQQRMAQVEGILGDMTTIVGAFADEQSDILKAVFIAEKAAGIARAIVAIQTGIAQAAAVPFPANLAAMASVAAATASIVSTIQSTNISGQAHDGLMSVPSTGTYLLEKGERVTTERTSAKLDRTLDEVRGGGVGGNIRVIVVQDMAAAMEEYLNTEPGERAVMTAVSNNRSQIQNMARDA